MLEAVAARNIAPDAATYVCQMEVLAKVWLQYCIILLCCNMYYDVYSYTSRLGDVCEQDGGSGEGVAIILYYITKVYYIL